MRAEEQGKKTQVAAGRERGREKQIGSHEAMSGREVREGGEERGRRREGGGRLLHT
jgi:hypothetical protein